MTNSIETPQVFNHPQFGEIRTITINNQPWFVGKDVAAVLGYRNPRKAIIDHINNEDKDDGVTIRDSIGREQKPIIINESGFYSLVLSSKLPQAQEFKHWVTSEVLPQIRQTGGYIPTTNPKTGETLSDTEILALAMEIKDRTLKLREEKIRNLEQKITEDAPKVEFAEIISESPGDITLESFSKILGSKGYDQGPHRLAAFLRRHGYLITSGARRNVPYQRYIDCGYFTLAERYRYNPAGIAIPYTVTMITGKGQEHLFHKFFSKIR